ncbi:MAG: hypothetical protein D6701_10465 [Gemmatimonadetes bacterium]|nr:MAG: hypothetical protein D6701_10465 [Gemmatimonadota bacterium]
MASLRFRHFSSARALKRFEPACLIELLRPYRDYFKSRDWTWPEAGEEPDYQSLANVLMAPGSDTPDELLDALFFIDEMSTEEAMDGFLEDPELRREVGERPTPADVALRAYLRDPDAFERKHAEANLRRPRSFESYLGPTNGNKATPFTETLLQDLERSLDEWFVEHKRGRGCRVFHFSRNGASCFLVRHGAPYRREGRLEQGEPSSIYYRPERFDVVVYDVTYGELRMNAGTKGEKDLYREKFGLHLFGSTDHFLDSQKFTLEPLRSAGRAALVCDDVEGLEEIKLKEVHYFWGGEHRETEIRKADDVFAALEARNRTMPRAPLITAAKFRVKFSDARTPRIVTVRVPNGAQYTRDSDGELIDEWLAKRGFLRSATAS